MTRSRRIRMLALLASSWHLFAGGCSDDPAKLARDSAARDSRPRDAAADRATPLADSARRDTWRDGSAPDSASPDGAAPDSATRGPCAKTAAIPGFAVGVSTFGTAKRIEYIPGDLPVIIAAPHGGTSPMGLPLRSASAVASCSGSESFVTNGDSNSQAMARAVAAALKILTGRSAHLVFNHIQRDRLDANRSQCVAAAGSAGAAQAWTEFHGFIDAAKSAVAKRCGRGFYVDMHTHAHADTWVELGYLLGGSDLARSDAQLDSGNYAQRSSIAALTTHSPLALSALLRGPTSFGATIAKGGFTVVPSPATPNPSGRSFFSGGFNTRRHGSRDSGVIDAVQIESHFSLMNSATKRASYGDAIARALIALLETHYGYKLR